MPRVFLDASNDWSLKVRVSRCQYLSSEYSHKGMEALRLIIVYCIMHWSKPFNVSKCGICALIA